MRESLSESGVSEVVGTVLLIALVVLGVAIVAAALFSQSSVTEIPHASIVAGENASGNFVLVHEGGDALREGEYRIYVDDGTGLEDETVNFTAPVDGVWSIGENITYNKNPDQVKEVVVTAVTGRGETILAEPAFSIKPTTTFSPDPVDPGTGGGSVTPTPTPTASSPVNITNPASSSQEIDWNHDVNYTATVHSENVTRVDLVIYDFDDTKRVTVKTMTNTTSDVYYEWVNIVGNTVKKGDNASITVIAYNGSKTIGYDTIIINIPK